MEELTLVPMLHQLWSFCIYYSAIFPHTFSSLYSGCGKMNLVRFNWNKHRPMNASTNLSAEIAGILSVLGDFYFFHHLSKRGPIPCAVLPYYPYFLGALSLETKIRKRRLILSCLLGNINSH